MVLLVILVVPFHAIPAWPGEKEGLPGPIGSALCGINALYPPSQDMTNIGERLLGAKKGMGYEKDPVPLVAS